MEIGPPINTMKTINFCPFLLLLISHFFRRAISGSQPIISEHPLDILVAKGDPATLRCGTSGDEVEVNWYKDGEPVRVGNGHRLLLPNGSLFLLKVNSGGTDSDAGAYYCVARNQFGEVRSQEANVRVAMLRDDFRVNPHAVQALIGNRVSLECSPPKGFPEPIVTWRKDERELNMQDEQKYHQNPDGSLIIENAQRSDAGFYQCMAANMVGERVSKPARLSVYEKPRFLTEPKNAVVEVNGSVLFECRVVGEPMPSISWKKRDGQMPVGRAYVARDRGGLRIDKIQPDDAGDYICFAKNPVGSIESSAQLRVNAPPVFTKLPQNLRLAPGRSAVFECEANGQPTPGIFWSKEGDQLFTFFSGLVSSDGRIQVTKEGRLIIDDIRSFDQGNYICAAVNSAGSTLAKASLGIINDATSSFPPPIIQYGHQNQTLMVNDMAILPCQATGRVPVKIAWLRDGVELDLNATGMAGRFRQLPVGTLQIGDLKKEDTGVYTCRARNEDGEATWTASLVVEEHTSQDTTFQRMPDAAVLPSSPGQPKVLNVSEADIELEWSVPERHGASPIVGYIIQFWSPEMGESWQNVLDVVPNTRFRVKSLRPGNSYVFVIRAENSKGIGLPSPISEMATTRKLSDTAASEERDQRMSRLLDLETARQRLASEQLVKLLEVRALNATAMLLTWKRQRKEPLVQGYYIKWRGPPLAQDHSWVNVTNPDTDHVLINGLRPFNNYEFFVIPYHQQVQGMPSNSLDGTTAESPPSMPPSDVRLRMLNVTSLRVSWRPPPSDAINGILKGFLINIRSNHSSVEDRNITTNERATSVTLYRLIPNASYAIRVAARTNAGVGAFFNGESVVMTEETLRRHIRLFERVDGAWYRQPWSVLACGIILWCVLLLAMVFLWYKCCHRSGADGREAKEREFIKIRDGSVANTVLGDTRNAFWAAHEQFNGGTCETSTGTLARVGQQHLGHLHGNYMDYPIANNGSAAFVHVNNTLVKGMPLSHATLQRLGGAVECVSPHSQHYHYAQLPPVDHHYPIPEQNSLSTFLQQQRPEYYDDPSPYATTTLVNPAGEQTLRNGATRSSHGGPSLPTKPVPKEPPRHFLSKEAVMQSASTEQRQYPLRNGHLEKAEQPNSNSCGAILELERESKHHQNSITAGMHQQQHFKRDLHKQQHRDNRFQHLTAQQQFGTTGRPGRDGGSRKSTRSSSVNTSGSTAFCSLRRSSRQQSQQQQQESPQTDISYVQSSDGTSGSSSNHRQTNPNHHHPSTSPYKQQQQDEAPEYDPVMTESLHQLVQENVKRRKGRERTGRQSARNRVSLIEDEEQEEQDPLMHTEDEEECGREADAELSDEYVHNGSAGRTSKALSRDGSDKEQYYGFSPAPIRPNRQPMMGVNVSTLSVGGDRRSTTFRR